MILFLSNLHRKRNNDDAKLLWSSAENEYSICQRSQTVWCRETNEAPLKEVLMTIGKPLDAIFYFFTEQVGRYPPKNGTPLKKRIEIAFPPNYTASEWYDSEAHFFWKVRAKEVAGNLLTETTKLVPVSFEDNGDGNFVGDAISAVRLMESAIKKYLEDEAVPLQHCYLYADITGGKRTANMAMSAVIQLLQYEGIHLRSVVYSDFDSNRKGQNGADPIHPVGNVQPIHDMHRLVAGVDAFKKYGSSAALNDFFKDEIERPGKMYPPLKALLSAMDNFSGSVLLCQPDPIEAHLDKLIKALQNFPPVPPEGETRPPKVELLARMLPELHSTYERMYPVPEPGKPQVMDRLEVIKWCVRNTLLQPAATFCVEWMPEFFEEHGIAYTDDPLVQAYCESEEFENYRPGWKNFLMEFCTRSPALPLKSERHKKIEDKDKKTGLNRLDELAQKLQLPNAHYAYSAKLQAESFSQEPINHKKMGNSCWRTASVSRAMIACGMMKTDCDVELALDLIRDYTYIRAYLRNKMNHASQQDQSDGNLIELKISKVQPYLQKFLDRVELQKPNWHEPTNLWKKGEREARWAKKMAEKEKARKYAKKKKPAGTQGGKGQGKDNIPQRRKS